MSDEYHIKFKELAESKRLLELELEQKKVSSLREKLAQESTVPKRRSSEQSSSKRKIVKTCERDTINIIGLTGTLGANLLRLGEEININNSKSRYFAYLSKNSIIDISINTPDSQISLLGGAKIQRAILAKLKNLPQDNFSELEKSKHLDKECKKINNIRAASNALRVLLLLQASSIADNIEIYTFILNQHVNKQYIFSDNYLKKCSEQSIIIKFWGPLFETFFTKRNVFLQWGDTIPEACIKNELAMRLDLRMMFEGENLQVVDSLNGEFAKIGSTTKRKYYDDKTKLVLAGKCHLNQIITSLGGLSARDIESIKLPLIQVMGLNLHIYSLSIIDKNVYLLQKLKALSYPRSLHEIKSSGIKKMIIGFQLLQDMTDDLQQLYNEYSRNTTDAIHAIHATDNAKSKTTPKTNLGDYISAVFFDDTDYEVDVSSGDDEDIYVEEVFGDSENSPPPL